MRTRFFIKGLLFAALGLSATAVAAEDVHIYLIGGQSNATGRADASKIDESSPLASPQTDVSLWYRNTQGATNNTLPESQIIDLAPGSGFGTGAPVYPKEFGPEVAFGRTLADALPDQNIMIVKHTYGGSIIRNGNWTNSGGSVNVYEGFMQTAAEAIQAVKENGDNPILMGMIWVQGEANTGGVSHLYAADLTSLISRIRTDLFDGVNAPFVFSQLSDNQYVSLSQGVLDVRAGQLSVSQNVANTAMVVTDGDEFSTISSNRIHYDANGQIALGTALGNEMVALVPEPSSLVLLAAGGLTLLRRRR